MVACWRGIIKLHHTAGPCGSCTETEMSSMSGWDSYRAVYGAELRAAAREFTRPRVAGGRAGAR